MAISLNRIKKTRNLPFIKRGMKIAVNGKIGKITSGNRNLNLNVLFEGELKPRNVHPFWKTKYYDENENIIKEYN